MDANCYDLSRAYLANKPFPHIVIDNFYPQAEISKVVAEVENLPEQVWTRHQDPTSVDCAVQRKKMALNQPYMLEGHAPWSQKLMSDFNSPLMLAWMSQLTGIPDLIPDPYNVGGGIHRTKTGGKLSVHADFNIHPKSGLHRRVNALLYLNRDWQESWGGNLELWDSEMKACQIQVSPIVNRLVVFNTTDNALHGHPEPLACPDDRCRLSFAFYYYTTDRPAKEKAPFHWANWQSRPEKGF